MATYAEQLAGWRAQRRQQEANNRLQELRQEHAEALRERDTAIANNDLELAASADDQCQYLENEYTQLVGPQQPQVYGQTGCGGIRPLSSVRASVA